MLKIKGWLRAAALCVAFCLLLTGCSIPMQETMQVEELLRAPRLAGDYGALQTALNDWLGESAQLKYPLQGDLLSPFVLQDFDGDGDRRSRRSKRPDSGHPAKPHSPRRAGTYRPPEAEPAGHCPPNRPGPPRSGSPARHPRCSCARKQRIHWR